MYTHILSFINKKVREKAIVIDLNKREIKNKIKGKRRGGINSKWRRSKKGGEGRGIGRGGGYRERKGGENFI